MTYSYIILGLSRSGSKMLKQILDNHPDLYTTPELGFYSPYGRSIYKELKENGLDGNTNKLRRISPKFTQFVSDIDYNDCLKHNDLKSLYECLIFKKTEANKPDARIIGSKFPFHFSFLSIFKSWYSNGKVIFLVRDPRAICASEIIMKTKIKGTSKFPLLRSNFFNRKSILFYVLVQTIWYSKFLKKYESHTNFKVLKYENLLDNSGNEVNFVCQFLNVEYQSSMLEIKVKGSSYSRDSKSGISQASKDKWRKNLKKDEIFMINLLKPFYHNCYKSYFKS